MAASEVVLITGCSHGGIGDALAIAFANHSCIVIATSRSLASLRHLQDIPNIETLPLDVTSQNSRHDAVSAILERHGRIDILVNNAGVFCVGPVAEVPLSHLKNAFETNVYGPVGLIQLVIPQMIARNKGKIVNIGSVAAFSSAPWGGGYSASKAAIHSLTDSLRVELKPFGIHVVTVAPGGIKSNIVANTTKIYENIPAWKFYQPWENNIRKRFGMSQRPGYSTASEDFAAKTVKKILKTKPPISFVYGYFSTRSCLLYYLPLRIRDYLYTKMFLSRKSQNSEKCD